MYTTLLKTPRLLTFLLSLGLISSGANAAGFAIAENSASGIGSAFSTGGAAGEDATTVWANPASMTLISDTQGVIAVHYIAPQADFSNQGSTLATGGAITGPNADGGASAIVPNLCFTTPINEKLFAGISINAPFGLGTVYDDDWVGRYHAVETHLTTVNINPAIAYKLNEQWSFGAGVSLQYVDVTLTSAIDFGSLLGSPQAADGFGDLTADNTDDLSFGWNIGALYEFNKDTRISAAYRSEIEHNVEGDADFSVPTSASIITSTGAFTDTGLTATVSVPASASLSIFHALDEKIDLMADITWTQWSTFEELRIKYDNPSQPDSVTTEDYQDQFRIALGGRYHLDEKIILRTGIAYDQKAVKSAELRTPRIPDNDRTWLSFGLGYAFSETIKADFGYTHLFIADTPINNTFESSQAALNHTLTGEYTSSVDILSAQLIWNF